MKKIKRYYCDTICYQGVNGYMIYDRTLKDVNSPIAFSTRYAQIICDALNAKKTKRVGIRKPTLKQLKIEIIKKLNVVLSCYSVHDDKKMVTIITELIHKLLTSQ
jgi:hypothetical protein